jgi:hypothetical protein
MIEVTRIPRRIPCRRKQGIRYKQAGISHGHRLAASGFADERQRLVVGRGRKHRGRSVSGVDDVIAERPIEAVAVVAGVLESELVALLAVDEPAGSMLEAIETRPWRLTSKRQHESSSDSGYAPERIREPGRARQNRILIF